jgi:hypothetical protein
MTKIETAEEIIRQIKIETAEEIIRQGGGCIGVDCRYCFACTDCRECQIVDGNFPDLDEAALEAAIKYVNEAQK